jgi:hypothetical protein
MALRLATPAFSISRMIGSTLAANRLAFAFSAAVPRFTRLGFGALRDHLPFVLRHRGQDMQTLDASYRAWRLDWRVHDQRFTITRLAVELRPTAR